MRGDRNKLRQVLVNRTDKQVYLRGDGTVQLQDLMDVFGRLKEAGVEKIGVVVPHFSPMDDVPLSR